MSKERQVFVEAKDSDSAVENINSNVDLSTFQISLHQKCPATSNLHLFKV
jgi:hypothetical protein